MHPLIRSFALGSAILLLLLSGCGSSANSGASPSAQSITELKYDIMAKFGPLLYCDRDAYPIGRTLSVADVSARLDDIKTSDLQTYNEILRHDHLTAPLTPAQERSVYADYKQLTAFQLSASGQRYAFAYPAQTSSSNQGTMVRGTIDSGGSIAVTSRSPYVRMCPICLAAWTTIATPNGPIAVTDLQVGMPVWTMDQAGHRIAGTIIELGDMQAPVGHSVVHLMLADGRQVWVSAGHPTTDGRHVGDLVVGDYLDGSRVVSVDRVPYVGKTYDLLPSGPTGAYWADGVPLKSSL
jgi:hypothetical protein